MLYVLFKPHVFPFVNFLFIPNASPSFTFSSTIIHLLSLFFSLPLIHLSVNSSLYFIFSLAILQLPSLFSLYSWLTSLLYIPFNHNPSPFDKFIHNSYLFTLSVHIIYLFLFFFIHSSRYLSLSKACTVPSRLCFEAPHVHILEASCPSGCTTNSSFRVDL